MKLTCVLCFILISSVFALPTQNEEYLKQKMTLTDEIQDGKRIARSPLFYKHHGLFSHYGGGGGSYYGGGGGSYYGGGYHSQPYYPGYGGGFGGAQAQAQAGGYGGSQAQAQSQSLSFGFGPFGASLSQSQAQAQSGGGRRGGGFNYYDY